MTPNEAWLVALVIVTPIAALALAWLAIHETRHGRRDVLPAPQRDAVGPRHFADT